MDCVCVWCGVGFRDRCVPFCVSHRAAQSFCVVLPLYSGAIHVCVSRAQFIYRIHSQFGRIGLRVVCLAADATLD